jgi:hypothetical protein
MAEEYAIGKDDSRTEPLPESGSAEKRRVIFDAVILVLLAAVLLAHVLMLRYASGDWLVDDALISFRYAENFASGNGLVFNPGEHVEGYTNFLWTILLGMGTAAGFDVFTLALILGTAAAAASLVGSCLIFSTATGGRRSVFRFAAPFALALSMPFALWAFGGLEVPLFAAIFTFAICFFIMEKFKSSGAMFGLLALTRPEGVAIFIAAAAYMLVSRRKIGKELIGMVLLFAAFAVPHEIFRIVYYGDLVPNTFHAKVGMGLEQIPRGLDYIGRFAMEFSALVLVIPFFAAWNYYDRRMRFLIYMAAVSLLLVVYTGGDALPAFRFMVPLLAILYVMLAATVDRAAGVIAQHPDVLPFVSRAGAVLFMFMVAAAGMIQTFAGPVHDHVFGDKIARDGEFVGKWLRANSKPGDTVACNSAGGIPYYSGLRAIDMLGLNDRHIAMAEPPGFGHGFAGHEKYDADYVLARLPEYVVFGSASYTGAIFPGDRIMERHYIFRRMYGRRVVHPRDSGAERPFMVWARSVSDKRAAYKLFFELAKERGDLRIMLLASDLVKKEFPGDSELAKAVESVGCWKAVGKRLDFETGDYSGWAVESIAFGDAPASGAIGAQDKVLAFNGGYLVNTFHGSSDGDAGKLTSGEFIIEGDVLAFRIGGGFDPSKLVLRFVIDGRPVRTATGNNSEILEPGAFDVSDFKGKPAHIEIVDENTNYWGHILVDDIVQYRIGK